MHLRVESAQPYTLFPTKSMFPPQPPPPPPSTMGYQPLFYPHQYQQQQQQQQSGYSYCNNSVKRSSSAFEPLFHHQQYHAQKSSLPPSPPSTPTTHMDRMPTLADFAASIVYLMWHARKPSLMANTTKPSSPYRHSFSSVSGNASPAFKRFCLQVLTATQLSESAVFLALKYIANLLESNPSIEGAEGSEYRLFIVALMLANKFLDDNTFTNKTWSEVSGMKVQDLNIMEAEFLEALEYNLFVREHDYMNWKTTLDTCRQQHQYLAVSDHPFRRQELIQSTLQSLGLYKPLDEQQNSQDFVETDDDDDDDDDEVDDEEELFQMMHHQHNLRQQQEEQQRAMWSAAASATRVQLEQSQRQYQLYLMQQQEQYRQSITTPPLSLSSSSTSTPFQRRQQQTDTTSSTTARHQQSTSHHRSLPSYMQTGPAYTSSSSHQHRASSVYRSTSIPPGFQRRSSPWESISGRYSTGPDRCGESFYSHQPFHPYQRHVSIAPPPSLRATPTWCE
ncbi:uncharacterized protein BX664DRAFT_321651 [Halteromyces radiatus]|uniref:uncharacterized protein n=1 Tax=Halteromyces radiatus TaxID=101107 RepID=UPI00221F3008|nr:uncharacterized protein BX664DRAFT_321651 [Halteromyces radiatus]KAI8099582.1 hypothetical protein BX664DRAFT_321651 [Halteromyces radiatus]